MKTGPAGLMTGADPCAGVAVEMLVEQHVIAPVLIGPTAMSAVGWAASSPVSRNRRDNRRASSWLTSRRFSWRRADRALDLEIVPKVHAG